jgi:hypothetical protein
MCKFNSRNSSLTNRVSQTWCPDNHSDVTILAERALVLHGLQIKVKLATKVRLYNTPATFTVQGTKNGAPPPAANALFPHPSITRVQNCHQLLSRVSDRPRNMLGF